MRALRGEQTPELGCPRPQEPRNLALLSNFRGWLTLPTRLFWSLLLVALLLPFPATAHVGSPDVFYDGMVGPYPARITIGMPGVVPGRAEISVRVRTDEPVKVSFLPLYTWTAVTNAPPPDPGLPVAGEKNLFSGELWLMEFGAYSIDVRIRGESGEGAVQLPVNAVATRQLPLPSFLGKLLLALGAILFLGGIAIVAAAARDSVLATGVSPGQVERRKGWIAAAITTLILVGALVGGKKWWSFEETDFRRHLREGAWPDLAAEARFEGSQRILRLTLGQKAYSQTYRLQLMPDHGKLLHVFLVREPGRDAFAHVHPVRKGGKTFELALPPLPEGDYKIFCDLTFEESGMSSTATNSLHIPPMPANASGGVSLSPDPDDSWATNAIAIAAAQTSSNVVFRLPGGQQVIWNSAQPIRVKQDAALQFELRDAAGQPLPLEPYMGMLSHVAVLRSDGAIFAHLHPSGNFSMAAQQMFQEKLQRETGGAGDPNGSMPAGMDHSRMSHAMHHGHGDGAPSRVSLPYEFPAPGEYRLWVQFKSQGEVFTGVFDASVLARARGS